MVLFSGLHIAMVLFVIFVCVFVCVFGKMACERGRGRSFDVQLGVVVLLGGLGSFIYDLMPGNFTWEQSLPIHVCDVVGIVAGIAMIYPSRYLRAVVYFVGIALSTQSFITPTGIDGPWEFNFWIYWGYHAAIVACAMYDLVIRNYRPTFGDFLFSVAFTFLYILIIFPFNIITGLNYAYIGNAMTDEPTLIDFLGEWPVRVVYMVGLAVLAEFLVLLPWEIYRRWKGVMADGS